MDWIEVLNRIAAGENETTEFKQWSSSVIDKVAIAACAFANTEGGLIILGVDNLGRIVGVARDADSVQEIFYQR